MRKFLFPLLVGLMFVLIGPRLGAASDHDDGPALKQSSDAQAPQAQVESIDLLSFDSVLAHEASPLATSGSVTPTVKLNAPVAATPIITDRAIANRRTECNLLRQYSETAQSFSSNDINPTQYYSTPHRESTATWPTLGRLVLRE